MSNPDFDSRASASEVIALLRGGQGAEALTLLDQVRQEQPLVLQEALDRYVAGQEPQRLAALRADANPAQLAALNRLDEARHTPRLPNTEPDASGQTELSGLSATQQHDVYASMVYTRGNEAARLALERGDRVMLGLRQETSTLSAMESADRSHIPRADDPATTRDESRAGTGVYDDQMVVLWRSPEGVGDLHLVRRANTEPTAQYDHHAGSDGTRRFSEDKPNGSPNYVPSLSPSPGYADVTGPRKVEGVDINDDEVRDAGRLREGTYEMYGATHGKDGHAAFRPTPEAVSAGADRIERDTNADGRFDAIDPQRFSDLDRSFKIHRGSNGNTDSAGCQTIQGRAEYNAFLDAANPSGGTQTRWQYVLTGVKPSDAVVRAAETATPTVAPEVPAPEAARGSEAGDAAAPQPQITPEQRAAVFKAYGEIGSALQSHGHSLDEAVRACAACAAIDGRHGDVTRFLLSRDGARIGALHSGGRFSEIDVSEALARTVPEHLSEGAAPQPAAAELAMVERTVPALGGHQR
jgi:hypothetical protein